MDIRSLQVAFIGGTLLTAILSPVHVFAQVSINAIIIDATQSRLLRYSSGGTFLNELVPPGSGGLLQPEDVTLGPDGDIYVTSVGTQSVKHYARTSGAYRGDFVAPGSGGLVSPKQLSFGPDGNLYVADSNLPGILRYNGQTGASMGVFVSDSRLANNFKTFAFGPDGFVYALQSLLVNSNQAGCVLRYDGQTGAFVDTFWCAQGQPSSLSGIAFGPDDKLYIGHCTSFQIGPGANSSIWQLDGKTGQLLNIFASGDGTTQYLRFGPNGYLYVSSQSNTITGVYDVVAGIFKGHYPQPGQVGASSGFVFDTPRTTLHLSDTGWTFEPEVVGTPTDYHGFSLTNTGSATAWFPAQPFSSSLRGTEIQTNCVPKLTPGASCNVTFRLVPSALGPLQGTLTMRSFSTDSPNAVEVHGAGYGVHPSSTSWGFSPRAVGSTSTAGTIYLTNHSNMPMDLLSTVSLTGPNDTDFALTNGCSSTVAPFSTCALSFTWTPLASGGRQAQIAITSPAVQNGLVLIPITGHAE